MLNHRIRCMYRRWHRLKRITLISFIHELTHNNIRDILIQHYFIAELWPAKRTCGVPWVSKSSHTRKFGNHVTVHRPPACCPSVRTTGIPMFTLTLSSYFGSQGKSWLHINVVINWQLSKQGIHWPVSPDRIAGSDVDPLTSSIFWSYLLTIYSFSNDRRLTFTFF